MSFDFQNFCNFHLYFPKIGHHFLFRSIYNLDDWLFFLTYGTIYRYAGAVINYNEFYVDNASAQDLLGRNGMPCGYLVDSQSHCRYLNSTDYLLQRYTRPSTPTLLYMDVSTADCRSISIFQYTVSTPRCALLVLQNKL